MVWQGTYRRIFFAAVAVSIAVAPGHTAAAAEDVLKPSLADLMTITQLRHFKLWYAQRLGNWKLASYELERMSDTLGRAAKLYPDAAAVAQDALTRDKTGQVLSDLRTAVDNADAKTFEASYRRLTEECNACHKAAGTGFIVVQVPTRSPFSNQSFKPSP
ncbi:hypothetical protein [Prosthecomicrobium sp. N25]|uniref:hypothetical protein n=1 Tax=Prosthecomicrobium sp. N25 TaxID=3129254 RepID=UPI003077AB32